MKGNMISILALCLAVTGCASVSGTDAPELAQLPVVKFGQPVPDDGQYILHFPAGVPIETPVTFKGNLFEQAATEVVSVKPVRDIYVHKEWMSYDKHLWVDGNQSIDLKVNVILPGYHHPQPGHVVLEMNAVE